MADAQALVPIERPERIILTIRGLRVILDNDLARLYGVSTKALNQAVKRHMDRFPEDFAFQLSAEEKDKVVTDCDHLARLKFSPVLPRAFTEHGAIMAATVLSSPRAIQASVFVVRAFVKFRETLVVHRQLHRKLAEFERKLETHDVAIREIIDAIKRLAVLPPQLDPAAPKIGFRVKERRAKYRRKR
jgi:hypothetical protein